MLPFGREEGQEGDTIRLRLALAPEVLEPETEAVRRRLALLESVALFFSLPDHALRKLARRMEPMKIRKGEVLVGLGEVCDRLYVIEEGQVELGMEPAPGQSMAVMMVGERDVVGASSLLHNEPSSVFVMAVRDCKLLVLSQAALLEVAPKDSDLHQALKRIVAQRRARLKDMAARLQTGGSRATSSVIAVYSPKGGSGKSTIAVSLAATLSGKQHGEVLLFDLALPYNHAHLLTKLTPTSCLARIADLEGAAFDAAVASLVLFHPSGLMVLPSALLPEEADLITADLVARSLAVLRRTYRYIVFDLGTALNDPVITALENADQLVAVGTPELSALNDLSRLYPMLERVFRIPLPRVHLVVNHRSPNSVMGERDVKNLLRREVAAEIRYDGTRPEEAAVRGHLLTPGDPRSAVARGTTELARKILRAETAAAL